MRSHLKTLLVGRLLSLPFPMLGVGFIILDVDAAIRGWALLGEPKYDLSGPAERPPVPFLTLNYRLSPAISQVIVEACATKEVPVPIRFAAPGRDRAIGCPALFQAVEILEENEDLFIASEPKTLGADNANQCVGDFVLRMLCGCSDLGG